MCLPCVYTHAQTVEKNTTTRKGETEMIVTLTKTDGRETDYEWPEREAVRCARRLMLASLEADYFGDRLVRAEASDGSWELVLEDDSGDIVQR